jgi:hypothetical protein
MRKILIAPAAHAETCRGSLGRIRVDDLLAPDGATCTPDGTNVQGDILYDDQGEQHRRRRQGRRALEALSR